MKRFISIGAIVLTTVLVCSAYFQHSFPYTHDGENHLARFANYYVAVKEGQLPPRFAPNLLNRYGYPVFNYNYPLANMLSVPLRVLSLSYQQIFSLLTILAVLAGGIGTYLWTKSFGLSDSASLLAGLTLLSAPYLTNLLLYRGTIGETIALALIPWMILLTTKLLKAVDDTTKDLGAVSFLFVMTTLLWTAFFLAHNSTVLIGAPLVCIVVLSDIWLTRKKLSGHSLKRFLLVLGASIGLSLWFWLPALLELDAVVLSGAQNNTEYSRHFPTVDQLLFSSPGFGFSQPSAVDGLSFRIGWAQLMGLIISILALLQSVRPKERLQKRLFAGLVLLCGMLIFLEMEVSLPIWNLPLIRYVQFPWRLSGMLIILIGPLIAYGFDNSKYIWKLLLATAVVMQLSLALSQSPVDQFFKTNDDHEAFTQTTSTQNENLPINFTYENIADWEPTPKIDTGVGTIQVSHWSGSQRTYDVLLETDAIIIEPTAFFPGWITTIGTSEVQYLPHSQTDGRIGYFLPKGEYRVHTRFTQNTLPRTIGSIAFIVTFSSLVGWLVWHQIKR